MLCSCVARTGGRTWKSGWYVHAMPNSRATAAFAWAAADSTAVGYMASCIAMRRSTSSSSSVVSCSCVLLTAWIAEGTQPEYQVARYSMPPMLGSHIRWVVALQHTCRVRQGLRPRRARYFCVSPPCFPTLLLMYVAQLSLTRLLTHKARLLYG